MDDQWGAVFGKNIFKKTVEEYISVHFRYGLTIIPGGRSNKTMIRPLISSVNPVRNSSLAFNPAVIILKSNPAAEQWGIISNGVKEMVTEPVFQATQRFDTLHDI